MGSSPTRPTIPDEPRGPQSPTWPPIRSTGQNAGHLLIDGCWLSAYLTDTGTAAGNRPVNLQEFAVYRLVGGRIVEVWGDLDPNRLTA